MNLISKPGEKESGEKGMKRLVTAVILAVALVIVPVSGVLADTSQDVTITAQPGYIAIANSPDNWTINDVGLAGGKYINPDTIYYSNTQGDTTPPSSTVADNECHFSVTNTSGIATNIVVNFPNHTGGDASENSNLGTNDTTKFGAYGYVSGQLFANKVILEATGSDNLISSLAATTDFKWGIMYESQSNDWASGTAMTSTVVITATGA